MTATLTPTPVQRFYDNNNNPLVSGKVFTYSAGTTAKLATYKDSTQTAQNANPIILNARGEAQIWIPPNVAYKFVISPANDADPPSNPILTIDQIVNSQLITLYGGVDIGSSNAYILNFTANFTAYQDGIVIYWIPANTNTSSSTINVNGLGVVNILNADGSALASNQIIANQPAQILYQGGKFILLSPGLVSNGSFTATFASGWTTSPTVNLNYRRIGPFIEIYYSSIGAFTAISNSATATITGIPPSLRNSSSMNIKGCPCRVVDNGAGKGGWAYIDSFGNIVLGLGFDSVGGNFTVSGQKGIDSGWSVMYAQS